MNTNREEWIVWLVCAAVALSIGAAWCSYSGSCEERGGVLVQRGDGLWACVEKVRER